jgi:tight adherence protein B
MNAIITDAQLVPLIIASGLGLTIMLAAAAVIAVRSPVRAVQGRLGSLATDARPYFEDSSSVLRQSAGWRRTLLGRFLQGADNQRVEQALHRSGLPLRVGEYLAIRVLVPIAGAVIVGAFMGFTAGAAAWPVGLLLGAFAGLVTPPLVLRVATQRRAGAIETQLIELCDLMASMLRSGYGYTQALASTAAEMDDPLASELLRLVDTVRLGGNVDEALDELNGRLGSRDFDMIATAISIQRRSGGNLSEILDGVGETIRNRQALRMELAALTARERFSAVVVAGLPLVLVAALNVMDPDRYGLLFTDIRGQVIFALAMAMNLAGYIVIRRVSKVEV